MSASNEMKSNKCVFYLKRIGFAILIILIFCGINGINYLIVRHDPTILPTFYSEHYTDVILPDSNKPYTQKFRIQIYSLMFGDSIYDTGRKLLVSLADIDCFVSFDAPKENQTLFIIFKMHLNSYNFDSFAKKQVIDSFKFSNISIIVGINETRTIYEIDETQYNYIIKNNFGEIIVPILIPENWNAAVTKFIACKIENLLINTNRGELSEDILPDFGSPLHYYYYHDSVVYNETFQEDSYYNDIGTSFIIIDYDLLELSVPEKTYIAVFNIVALIMSFLMIGDWNLIKEKINHEANMKELKSLNKAQFKRITKISQVSSTTSLASIFSIVFLVISILIGYTYFPKFFLLSYITFNVAITAFLYLINIITKIINIYIKGQYLHSSKNPVEAKNDFSLIESYYKTSDKNLIMSILATIFILYFILSGQTDPLTMVNL